MALGIATTKHAVAFMSKILAGFGGGHIYNITLAADHDNGELVKRGDWNSFDNYDEKTGAITFKGVIRDVAAEGGFYVEVTDATDALFVYNTPKNPYTEAELADDALFYNAQGDVVKAYSLTVGDIFAISEEGFNGTPEVGKNVTFANHKYVVASGT